MNWSSPADLRAQLQRLWDRGDLLRARLTMEPQFPLKLRLRRPKSKDVADRFDEVRTWVRTLQAGAHDKHGFGYRLLWKELNHRVHGSNQMPVGASVDTESDALRLLGKAREAKHFSQLADETLQRFPEMRPWLERRPLALLVHADRWPRIMNIVQWFCENPSSGLYMRQIAIPGVDTKFIESHRGVLAELLDCVVPPETNDSSVTGVKAFERRYGLRRKPPLIRFRLLDRSQSIQGLTDLSVLPEEFAQLIRPVRRVFITENEINGLAFPDVPSSLVIFGLGYGLDRLGDVPWLRKTSVFYWGDLDTHGFAILDRLRATLPHARSCLMDRQTLEAHRAFWGKEPADQRFLGELSRLTAEEQASFVALRDDHLGECVRLEQERIDFAWVQQEVAAIQRDDVASCSNQRDDT